MRMDQHIKRLIEKSTFEAPRLPKHEALKEFTFAYKQAKELGNPFTLRACAANLGAMFVSLANPDAAKKGLQYLEEALPPDGRSDGASNGDLYFNMGLACELLGRYREAGGHFEKAWQAYKSERDNIKMELATLDRLVQVSQMREKPAEAVNWYLKLEDTYGRADKTVERLLAMVKRITLQHEHTMEGTQDALKECCDMVDSIRNSGQDSVRLLVQVAVLLTQLQGWENARKYLEEAQNTFEAEDGQTIEKAVVLQNLGTICNYMGDWEASLPYHRTAAQIYHHYAITSDPKTPLQPRAAKRCHGHVLANHAYACIHLDKVDEARLLFQEALRLAEESEDIDSKWQMKEALGAVHFRLAMHDIDLPRTMTASMKVALPESRVEHMDKSIYWYKDTLSDLARSPKRTEAIQDRVLQKFTLVQTFKGNASKVQYHLTLPNSMLRKEADVLAPGVSGQPEESHEKGSDKKGSDEVGCEESGSSDDDKEDDADDDDSDKEDDEGKEESSAENEDAKDERDAGATLAAAAWTLNQKPSLQRRDQRPLNVTQSMQGPQDEYLKKYQQQLAKKEARDEDESTSQQHNRTVRADVHQQKMQYSSSAESSSGSDEDADSDARFSEDEDKDEGDEKETRNARNRGPVPPLPNQSPPVTMKASGTYERPQDVDLEMLINPMNEGTVPAPSNYAELDFARRKSKRDPQQGESSGYEPVGPGRNVNKAQHQDGDSDAGDSPPLPENNKKNSRVCVLM